MDMNVFRINDRLIHGQIITAWTACTDAKTIIVADDKAAKDEFQQPLLRTTTPDSIALRILSVDDTIAYIQSDEGNGGVLLLMHGPEQALKFIRAGIEKDQINMGNMNMKKGKTKVLSSLWVFPGGVGAIKGIYGHGIRLEVRAVPSERSQDMMELLKECKLA